LKTVPACGIGKSGSAASEHRPTRLSSVVDV
jgi:hypothetical protein